MRSLNAIVCALRSGEDVTVEELRAAVVAFDVLLAQLDLAVDVKRLGLYFQAAEHDPQVYAGEANSPDNPDAVAWYRAMQGVGSERQVRPALVVVEEVGEPGVTRSGVGNSDEELG